MTKLRVPGAWAGRNTLRDAGNNFVVFIIKGDCCSHAGETVQPQSVFDKVEKSLSLATVGGHNMGFAQQGWGKLRRPWLQLDIITHKSRDGTTCKEQKINLQPVLQCSTRAHWVDATFAEDSFKSY